MELKRETQGHSRYYYVTASPLQSPVEGESSLIIETVQDISRQKTAEEELRSLNEFNRAIIDNTPVSVFTIDKNGMFTSVNPALAELSGLGKKAEEKLVGFNWLENPYTVSCGLADQIRKGLEGEPFELLDFPFTTYKGDRSQFIHFRGVPLRRKDGMVEGLLCIIEETTERVKISAQLRQEAKMSAIGRLAAGIAHELNNPLATLVAHAELACEVLQGGADDEADELRTYLEVVQEQTFRCKNIMKDLLSLPVRDGLEIKVVNFHAVLEEIMERIDFQKRRIVLTREFYPEDIGVMGDSGALRQVFRNILNNAIDAMEGRVERAIWVRTSLDGNRARVEFEDTGVGIPDKIVDLIFEPFFTTKDARKGMGLGLTLCYDFISRMGGNIEVKQRQGGGAIFKITLPVANKVEENRRP